MLQSKSFLMSLGYLSQLFQRHPGEIEAALDRLAIAPAVSINGVKHYDGDAYCQLADTFEKEILANG